MNLIQTTAPASTLVVSLNDAKDHLRITNTDSDDLITAIVKAANSTFERDCPEMQLISAGWTLYLDYLPDFLRQFSAHVLLYKYPISAIDSVKYYTPGDASLQTFTDVVKDEISYPGRIYFNSVPDLDYDKYNCLQINFTAGYSSTAAIPQDIIQALKLLIGNYYENPQAVMTGTQINELPIGYQMLVNNLRKSWI